MQFKFRDILGVVVTVYGVRVLHQCERLINNANKHLSGLFSGNSDLPIVTREDALKLKETFEGLNNNDPSRDSQENGGHGAPGDEDDSRSEQGE
jgi:hypothetical protein